MKKMAAIQSNYIPWKGYFDFIRKVDVFYLYDCVQYTPRNWRNRNRIKTAHGLKWLSIPLKQGPRTERVCDKQVVDSDWRRRHLQALHHSYAKAPFYRQYRTWLEDLYQARTETRLSDINLAFLKAINELLEIPTRLILLDHEKPQGDKTDNLIQLCRQAQAATYLTGPTTGVYIDEARFAAAGIELEWMQYDYPQYPQLYPPFEHKVSIFDLLFHEGKDALRFLGQKAA